MTAKEHLSYSSESRDQWIPSGELQKFPEINHSRTFIKNFYRLHPSDCKADPSRISTTSGRLNKFYKNHPPFLENNYKNHNDVDLEKRLTETQFYKKKFLENETDKELPEELHPDIDRGWAWVVVCSVFCTLAILSGEYIILT